MTDIPEQVRPLLGKAFPPNGLDADSLRAIASLQDVLDRDIAPMAAENDARGRYPTDSIAAIKRTGVLRTGVPRDVGGAGLSNRFSLEAQLRIAAADSSVAQIFKVHDELVREIFVYCPDDFRPRLARFVLEEGAIIGLAVAESGKKADDAWKTICQREPDGGYVISGQKIYTTAAAEADYIAVWAIDPDAEGAKENPRRGARLNFVKRDTSGLRIHRDWDALGQRATDSGTITFDSVRAASEMLASTPERAPLSHAPLRYQAGFAAMLIGIAIGGLRAAIPFIATKSRPWPSAAVDSAADDPYVRRLLGEFIADLASAYALTLACGDMLDAADAGRIDRTSLAIPIYAAKSAASRAAMRTTSELYALMGTRAAARKEAFDRYWRNVRTLSLHDPVDWKNAEIGRHVLTGWDPPFGPYQ